MALGEQLAYELTQFAYIGEANYRECPYDPDSRRPLRVDSITVSDSAVVSASATEGVLTVDAVGIGEAHIDVWMRATGLGEFYTASRSERLTMRVAVLDEADVPERAIGR